MDRNNDISNTVGLPRITYGDCGGVDLKDNSARVRGKRADSYGHEMHDDGLTL